MIRRAPLPFQQQTHHRHHHHQHHRRHRHHLQQRSCGGGGCYKSTVVLYLGFLLVCVLPNFSVLGIGPHCNQLGHGPADIIMASGRINPKYTWYKRGHKTYVPVVMDPTYSHKEHSIIVGGLHEIQEKTCVQFDFYDDEHSVHGKDYVYITRQTKRGCWSYIGRIGRGKQEIGLPPGCITHRTAMHEMMHALGFRHEHVRHDRDDYIIIFWGNIKRGRESNFQKRSNDISVGPYDYDSIMHYDRRAFSNNGMDTIQPLKNGVKIGVRQKMSHWDAKKINIMYGCHAGGGGSGGGHLSWSPEHDDHDPGLIDDALSSHILRNASSSPLSSAEIEVAYDELDYDPILGRGSSRRRNDNGPSNNYQNQNRYPDQRNFGGGNHLNLDYHHPNDNPDRSGYLHNNNNDYHDHNHDGGRGDRNHFESRPSDPHDGSQEEDHHNANNNNAFHPHNPHSFAHFSLESYPGDDSSGSSGGGSGGHSSFEDENSSAGRNDNFYDF